MDKVKHEIEAALAWLEEGNIERAKLHLGFALQWRNDEASQQSVQADGAYWSCKNCGDAIHNSFDICGNCGTPRS